MIQYTGKRSTSKFEVTVSALVMGADPLFLDHRAAQRGEYSPLFLPDEVEVSYVRYDNDPWLVASVLLLGPQLDGEGQPTAQRVRMRFPQHLPKEHYRRRALPSWVHDFVHANIPAR